MRRWTCVGTLYNYTRRGYTGHFGLAQILEQVGRLKEAIEVYEKITHLDFESVCFSESFNRRDIQVSG